MPRRCLDSIAIMHVASAGFFDVGPDDSDSERAIGLDETSVRIPAELVQTAPSARPLWP